MAKVKVSRKAKVARFLLHPAGKTLLVLLTALITFGFIGFTHFYVKYSRLIDSKLREGPFTNTSMIFAAAKTVSVGDRVSLEEAVAQLRRSGYSESNSSRMGWYHVRAGALEIFPGPDSYFDQEPAVIKFTGERIGQIVSTQDNTERPQYRLEPEFVTNLSDRNREKRRLVKYEDIPKVLVNAVVSAEDKRFFSHSGFDPFRIIKAAYVDIKEGRREQGASTLSMQLARSFWLTADKSWKRKAAETLITLQLEQKLTKEQIFEYYANQIPLGRRGSFNIHGFGAAAQAYFGKDVRQITLPEAAMLAGLIQRPSYFNPFRHPERMLERRNVVLSLMRQNGYITDREYAVAAETPLNLAPGGIESAEAPYFVDIVNDELTNQFQDLDFQSSSYRVYTTIDLNLQRAAAEAVRIGMQYVDEQLRRQRRSKTEELPDAQVALVAVDPRTGAIKALVGGRNYGVSQLNHAVAKRQPGSVFKPFVYTAAIEQDINGSSKVFTPLSVLEDIPTTFWFDGKPYEPGNYKQEYHGDVTLRQALAKSMNVATVKLAEMVGYENIVELANRAGMNLKIQPTPSVALGAYEVTPIEIAGAYTIFANHGVYVAPNAISMVRGEDGSILYQPKVVEKPVLDPRVAYMMVNLLEEVMRSGTAAGVRALGFTVPAAGKTGTSHDGWFAGFTSELICVVWVGFDDNRVLNLEGARSALPVWAEFMKRALEYREYRNVKPFEAPDGIVSVEIDPLSGQVATRNCPSSRMEVFIAGTQPQETCRLHGGSGTLVAGWDTPRAVDPAKPADSGLPAAVASRRPPPPPPSAEKPPDQPTPEKRTEGKKGFLRRLWGIFK